MQVIPKCSASDYLEQKCIGGDVYLELHQFDTDTDAEPMAHMALSI